MDTRLTCPKVNMSRKLQIDVIILVFFSFFLQFFPKSGHNDAETRSTFYYALSTPGHRNFCVSCWPVAALTQASKNGSPLALEAPGCQQCIH